MQEIVAFPDRVTQDIWTQCGRWDWSHHICVEYCGHLLPISVLHMSFVSL